jgi:hypothetical protein
VLDQFRRFRQAALERVHQVDDLGRRFDLRRRQLPPLRLGLDQGAQRVLIAVVERLGIEAARALVDDHAGEADRLVADLLILAVGLRLAYLVGGAQRRQQQPAAMRLDGDRMLAAREHDTAEPDLALLLQGAGDDLIGLRRDLAVGRHVIGLLEIDAVDLLGIDEGLEIDGLRRFNLDRIEVLVIEQDILALVDLIALDDVGAIDLLAGLLVDHSHAQPVMRRLAELVEPDAAGLRRGRGERHGTGDEGQAQVPAPDRGHSEILR